MQDLQSDPVLYLGLLPQTNPDRSARIRDAGTPISLDADLDSRKRMSLHIFHVNYQEAGLRRGDRAGQTYRH